MCGNVPFGEDAEDPFDIYEEIIKSTIQFPIYIKDKNAKIFINQLLSKIPEMRLSGSYASLKQHVWF